MFHLPLSNSKGICTAVRFQDVRGAFENVLGGEESEIGWLCGEFRLMAAVRIPVMVLASVPCESTDVGDFSIPRRSGSSFVRLSRQSRA
ncbi:hypothetical protein QQ045_001597 [Rhodiola kirilowii]